MESYSVNLDVFCGPLDLLLQLVKTDEIELADVSLASVADQFVEHIKTMEFTDIETAADFIVIACHLMEIKSRELLPREERGEEAGELPELEAGSDLIQRLLEYRAIKDLSRNLRKRSAMAGKRHGRGMIPEIKKAPVDIEKILEGVTLWDLVSAYARIARETLIDPRRKIVYDDIPIGEHIDLILDFLRSGDGGGFSTIVKGRTKKSHVLGAFLALLELVRQKLVKISQEEEFGEISLAKADPSEASAMDEENGDAAPGAGEGHAEESAAETESAPPEETEPAAEGGPGAETGPSGGDESGAEDQAAPGEGSGEEDAGEESGPMDGRGADAD